MEDGNFDELADPRLEKNYLPHEMARMLGILKEGDLK